VRVLVRDVVADYSERSLNSALPPIGDPDSVVRDVLDRVGGSGHGSPATQFAVPHLGPRRQGWNSVVGWYSTATSWSVGSAEIHWLYT
jgi:hypothetical protein